MILILFFLCFRFSTYRIRVGPELWAIAFIAGCLLTMAINLSQSLDASALQAFLIFMSWAQLVLLYVIFSDICRAPINHFIFWLAFVLTMTFMAMMTHLQVGGSLIGNVSEGRVGYEGVNLNRQAFGYALALVSACWYVIHFWQRSWLLLLALWGLIVLLSGSLLATGSRTGFVAFSVGMAFLLAMEFRRKVVPAYIVIVPAILLFVAWALYESPVILSRLDSALALEQTGGRDVLIAGAWELAKEKPMIGWGYDAPQRLATHIGWAGTSVDAHNAHMQIAMRFGFFVYALWLIFVISVCWRCWRCRRNRWCRLFFVLTMMTLAFSLTGSLATNLYFWVVMAAASQAHRIPGTIPELNRRAANAVGHSDAVRLKLDSQ